MQVIRDQFFMWMCHIRIWRWFKPKIYCVTEHPSISSSLRTHDTHTCYRTLSFACEVNALPTEPPPHWQMSLYWQLFCFVTFALYIYQFNQTNICYLNLLQYYQLDEIYCTVALAHVIYRVFAETIHFSKCSTTIFKKRYVSSYALL